MVRDRVCFGSAVREARAAAGLSQAELAGRVGVVKDTISRLERGAHEPTWGLVLGIADALRLPLEQLAGGVGTTPLSEQAIDLLARLKERHGVSEADVIEMALRRMARVDLAEGKWPAAAILDAASALIEKRSGS